MLKLELSDQVEKFRAEFRAWLDSNPPPVLTLTSLDDFIDCGREWQRKLAKGGWVAVHWPSKFGGRSLSLVEEAVVQEELVRVNSPQLLGLFGLTMVGPVLIAHGTSAQREKFLSRIRDASDIWCQGFSEPGAGSDLAAVKTRAEDAGDMFVVSGQKVWTSFAQIADWCFLLCRTSDEDKPHRGLTYLLLDMKSKGVSTRPLTQISGDNEFNELFLDEVPVPKENVVGQIGDGWQIAISTLMYERVVLTFARQLQSEVALRELLGQAVAEHKVDEHIVAERTILQEVQLAEQVADACAVRALAYEHLLDYSTGLAPGVEGSMDKLLWSESFQRLCKLGLSIAGPFGSGGAETGPCAADVHRYLYSRGRTIAAGTSEVQRNIIAERLLGLPRLANAVT